MDDLCQHEPERAAGGGGGGGKDDSGGGGGGSLRGVGLYSAVRVFRELQEERRKESQEADPNPQAALLPLERLWPHDQLHYHGTRALDRAIAKAGLQAGQEVLDVGAGLGGPARYLAHTAGVRVVGVELQEGMWRAARQITERTILRDGDRVRFILGDVLKMNLPDLKAMTHSGAFDCVVSILTVLHIADKAALFERCFSLLKPGGHLYLEDYYAQSLLTQETEDELVSQIGCAMPLPSQVNYERLLRGAGFVDVQFEDLTPQWWTFVDERARTYRSNLERHRQVQDSKEDADSLDHFYQAVAALFDPARASGLGGARISCRRPLA